ncbi:MAG TPA: hypothetical protein VKX41_15330 [Alloacidobacterium sp.]|nr:hypothetical protein [Alloacidobacterium sp.]
MNNRPINTRSHPESSRTLHVVDKLSSNGEIQADPSGSRQKTWLGVLVIALIGCCLIGLVVSNRKTIAGERPSPEQEHITALAKQISSLTQTDLIVFPDGRVWYVRSVRGKNLEVVGWVGANTRVENIISFVLREDHLTIVHRNDAAWPIERDRFLNQ